MWQPLGQPTANHAVSWEPGSDARGTWDILSTCLITLCLCVWTALHLNVPKNSAPTYLLMRKAKWLMVGLFAPELIVYIALQQRIAASRLGRRIVPLLRDISPPTCKPIVRRIFTKIFRVSIITEKVEKVEDGAVGAEIPAKLRKHPWTLIHSFYAVMGGFAINAPNAAENYFPEGYERLTLTAAGVTHLAEHYQEMMPDMSIDDIRDKSKASRITKALICGQALWFCMTTMGRLSGGYTISALELNTLAHALCCLLTYLLWWNKPLDIDVPTSLLENELGQEVGAAMCMLSSVGILKTLAHHPFAATALAYIGDPTYSSSSSQVSDRRDGSPDEDDSEFHHDGSETHTAATSSTEAGIRGLGTNALTDLSTCCERDQTVSSSRQVRRFQVIHGFQFRFVFGSLSSRDTEYRVLGRPIKYLASGRLHHMRTSFSEHIQDLEIKCNRSDLRRLQLAQHQFVRDSIWPTIRFRTIPDDTVLLDNDCPEDWFKSWLKRFVVYPQYLRRYARDLEAARPQHVLGLVLAGTLYGGIHLLAWSGPFSGQTELWIWRIACLCIIAPVMLIPIYLLHYISLPYWESLQAQWKLRKITLRIVFFLFTLSHPHHRKDEIYEEIKTGVPDEFQHDLEKWTNKRFSVLRMSMYKHLFLFLEFLCFWLLCLYVAARVFLVGNCFYNLVHLQGDVFKEPQWSNFFPHIG